LTLEISHPLCNRLRFRAGKIKYKRDLYTRAEPGIINYRVKKLDDEKKNFGFVVIFYINCHLEWLHVNRWHSDVHKDGSDISRSDSPIRQKRS